MQEALFPDSVGSLDGERKQVFKSLTEVPATISGYKVKVRVCYEILKKNFPVYLVEFISEIIWACNFLCGNVY